MSFSKLDSAYSTQRIALTLAPGGENDRNSELIGVEPEKGTGYTYVQLQALAEHFKTLGKEVELIDLNKKLPEGIVADDNAGVLIVRSLLKKKLRKPLFKEWYDFEWDSTYVDWKKDRRDSTGNKIIYTLKMHEDALNGVFDPVIGKINPRLQGVGFPIKGRLMNKRARKNICGQHGYSQEPTFSTYGNQGRIVDTKKMDLYCQVYETLLSQIREALTKTDAHLYDFITEGNLYYDPTRYIGWHGDTERSQVVCLSLGRDNFPLRYCWFQKGKAISEIVNISLNSGDLYIMSEKAVGMDWRSSSKPTLRHSAGNNKAASELPGKKRKAPNSIKKFLKKPKV